MPVEHHQCSFCQNLAEYSCSNCDKHICANDARIRLVCSKCSPLKKSEYKISQAFSEDDRNLEELIMKFWGDSVQLMFDQQFTVTEQPAFVAEHDGTIAGFIYYAPFRKDAVLIVALGVLPQYQGCGIGKNLVAQVEKFARVQKSQRLLVVTTNDNLPALAFYQRIGFQLYEVAPDTIAEKIGGIQLGVANIPIRDELRLQKRLS